METEKKFRKTLFGYRKKDVNAYIMDTAREFDKKKKQLEAEAADQAEKYKDLKKKYNALDSKVAALQKQRTYIADALLDAKQEAEKIVADAKVEAARMRSDMEVELTSLQDHPGPYALGDNEQHIGFRVDDFNAAHALHERMGCICYENPAMGIYFIEDPDGYWLEIIPTRD